MRIGRRQDGRREQPVDGGEPRCSSCQASRRADLAKASPPHCAIAFRGLAGDARARWRCGRRTARSTTQGAQ
jgi:hypothetical protein